MRIKWGEAYSANGLPIACITDATALPKKSKNFNGMVHEFNVN